MKRTFLAMLLVGSSCAVFAQDDQKMNKTTMSTTTDYNAYGAFTAPDYVQSYVIRDYPAATDVRWRQTADWWHGYYVDNGQPMHVYYNNAGQTFRVAIPVRQSLVPDDVVTKVVDVYGPMVYDVNTIRGANGQELYHVRLIDNGQVVSQWLNADGTKAIDVWRVDVADASLHTDMNAAKVTETKIKTETDDDGTETKIKTKTSDGKETKTKIKNGKVKTKVDD